MLKRLLQQFGKLRIKLMLAGLCVNLVLSAFLLANQFQLAEKTASRELAQRIEQAVPLLHAALIEPLLQRDEATLKQILEDASSAGLLNYYVLLDHRRKPIHRHPDAPAKIPSPDQINLGIPWERDDRTFHLELPIRHAGQSLGLLCFGVPLEGIIAARDALRHQGYLLAALGSLLGSIAFVLIGIRLTRGLSALTKASSLIMASHHSFRLEPKSNDELGQLAVAFNNMSAAIHSRIDALLESRAQQIHYLQESRTEHARLQSLLSSMQLGVLMTDQEQTCVYVNPAFRKLWRLPETMELSGLNIEAVLAVSPRYLESSPAQRQCCFKQMDFMQGRKPSELHLVDSVIEQDCQQVVDTLGNTIGTLWLFEDVTRERETQETISRLAERDSLTGVLNRHTFTGLLNRALSEKRCTSITLLYLDLDNFKLVNDLNGHAFGDQLLTQVAQAMLSTLRPEDIVGRLGGDEFVILLQNIDSKQIQHLCQRLIKNIANTSATVMKQASSGDRVGCSIGVSCFPADGHDAQTLIAAADDAMYAAKAAGRNTWRQFNDSLPQTAYKQDRLTWADRITAALEASRFEIHLQGIYTTDSRTLSHYEVLCRLPDVERPGNYFSPSEFIPIAESSGQIVALDRWIVARSIQFLSDAPQAQPLAVNLSARTLMDAELPEYIRSQLSVHGVPGERLHVELTETAALLDMTKGAEAIAQLKALGCAVGLDDFGSGFTSLSYLRHLAADYIKIDGLFVWGLEQDKENAIMLKALVDIAHLGGRKVIAEWIETERHLALIQEYNIDLVQGYLFDKPCPASELAKRLGVVERNV